MFVFMYQLSCTEGTERRGIPVWLRALILSGVQGKFPLNLLFQKVFRVTVCLAEL